MLCVCASVHALASEVKVLTHVHPEGLFCDFQYLCLSCTTTAVQLNYELELRKYSDIDLIFNPG